MNPALHLLNVAWCGLLSLTVCRILGHTPPALCHQSPFFQAWDGSAERGTYHCGRCYKMLGEYRKSQVGSGCVKEWN